MNDEHNLSGLIWQNDGSTPTTQTGFAIWVEYLPGSGSWSRYPAVGWYLTSNVVNGELWYSMVLPDEDFNTKWGDTAIYAVEVDGSPWGDFLGNTTSNGTGSVGDPFPPFDPLNPANSFNIINYAAGGGFMNEQQWDVRTTAPLDLVPTNITANGMKPGDYPGGMPVGPGVNVAIIFNVTNFGIIGTGIPFTTTLWNSTDTGSPIDVIWTSVMGPLNEFGNITGVGYDTGTITVNWIAPNSPGDYYINITVDSNYEIPEYDEDNNTVILFFKIGPDLEPFNVLVDSTIPSDPVFVGPGEVVTINANARNIGYSSTGVPTTIALYNITGPNGPIIPGSEDERLLPVLIAGETSLQQTWFWVGPWATGDYYVNISVDFYNVSWEANEANNIYTIHFYVGPDLVPNNVTVDGLLVGGYVTLTPDQVIIIGVNASNIGATSTGIYSFRITFTNCTATGVPLEAPFNISGYVGPVDVGGFSQDVYALWIMPLNVSIFDYYINITIDFENDVSEESESNNYFILNVKLDAPDLTFDIISLEVAGSNITSYFDPDTLIPPFVSDIIEVPLGEDSIIWVTIINVGGVNMTQATNVTFYNISGLGQPPNATPFWEAIVPPLTSGESVILFGLWPNPMNNGTYYINVSIDYNGTLDINGRILELNEYNNTFTLIINVTPIPITRINPGLPIYPTDATWRYIKSTTELNFTVDGQNPPYITYYRIFNMSNGSYATGWINYTAPIVGGNFTIVWGEGTYQIEYNSTDSVGGKESTKFRIAIVDDSEPITNLIVGDPQYREIPLDILNITSQTPLDLFAQDTPLGESPAGVGIMNASGINGIPESGMFYWIQNLDNTTDMTGWKEYMLAVPFYLDGTPTWLDGNYRIWFNSTDNLGHMEPTKFADTYLDNTGPPTAITVGNPKEPHPLLDWYVKSATPFILDAYEAQGSQVNISTIQYQIVYEGTIFSGWRTATSFDIATDFAQGDGNYSIQFRAKDNLGNQGPTGTLLIYVDDTPPITNLIIGEPKFREDLVNDILNISSSTQLSHTAVDIPGIGVNFTQYRIYNASFNTGLTLYLGAYSLPSTWTDGIYTVEYFSTDLMGNSEVPNWETIYLDNTPPITNISIDEPKYRVDMVQDIWNITSQTTLNLTFDDGSGCGVNMTYYRVFNSIYDSGLMNYTGNFTLSSMLSDGVYMVEYYSVDFLGNAEIAKNITIYLDNLAPLTQISVGNPKYRLIVAVDMWNITSQTTLNLTANDGAGCGVNYTLYRIYNPNYDTGWINYIGDFSLPSSLDDGVYTIGYNSTDYLGNNQAVNTNITLDNTGPLTSIIGGQNNWNPDQNAYEVTFFTFFSLVADDGAGSGVNFTEYRIRIVDDVWTSWQTYITSFNLTLNNHGYWDHTIEFRGTDNLGNLGPINSLEIYIEGDITPPLPPVLRTYVNGDDILLEWIPSESSESEDIHHYLIYRSTSKNGFDFSTVWNNTETAYDNGIIPLRTTWNDTGAAGSGSPFEYYYIIKGVDERNNIGYTSNIAGKMTLIFEKGYNAFSLPLEPFEDFIASDMLNFNDFVDDKDTLYRYETDIQEWKGHGKGMPAALDDFSLLMGEGYMIYITENQVRYTFVGAPGTSIRYIEGVGEDEEFRKSLTAEIDGDDVVLSWGTAEGASGYSIYRGITRIRENSLTDYSLEPMVSVSNQTTTWTDTNATGNEYYYLVVAQSDGKDQSSTYALGVKTFSPNHGYSSFSFTLDPAPATSLGSFAQEKLSDKRDTIYYYHRNSGDWQGHPKLLPENINTGNVVMGNAYLVFTHGETTKFAIIGI
jgi:hypothetical protein